MGGNDDSLKDAGWAIGFSMDGTAAIFHTANDGASWTEQGNPELWQGMNGNDISAVDAWTAWAALGDEANNVGMILHTTDGGTTSKSQALPNGVNVPVKEIKGLSKKVAWAVTLGGTVMRTLDGGDNWNLDAPNITGDNDIDDICAVGEDIAWAAQNVDVGGNIIRVRMVDGKAVCDVMDPMQNNYHFEGVTCFNENNLWVVGFKAFGAAERLPLGVILHTRDGGKTWTSQKVPTSDVNLWKVSFAGAFR